jgi:hypothetical protein
MKKKVLNHIRFLNLHYTVKEIINERLKKKTLIKILIFSYSDLLVTIIKIIDPRIIRIDLTE